MLKNSQFDFYSIQLFSSKCKEDTTYKTYFYLFLDNEDINFKEANASIQRSMQQFKTFHL